MCIVTSFPEYSYAYCILEALSLFEPHAFIDGKWRLGEETCFPKVTHSTKNRGRARVYLLTPAPVLS